MLHLHSIRPGDLRAINVVDVAKLSRPLYTSDPFDPYFDKIEVMHIAGTVVHTSRMCILDGDPLFSYSSQRIMENYRFNPCGFGESKLSTLYDALVRATGTQQGAYHLVNLSSCLILTCAQIRAMSAVGSPAKAKLEEVAEQLSIFRAAIVDGKEVEFKQHSATFGSVPELVMSFLQILSAGSDIPATRYLGQSPGGLNATGDSDLENYYNHIGAWQRQCLRPRQLTVFDWLGSNIWGYAGWKARSRNLKLEYEPLWNLDEVQQSQVDNTYGMLIHSLSDLGLISQQSALKELVERKVFKSVPEAGDFLASEMEGAENPFGPGGFGGSGSRDNGREAGSAGSIETRTENTRVYLLNAGEWDESKHTRGEDGKFGSGGASGGKQDITEILGKEHVGVKGQQAIDTLLREKNGHVKGAFTRSDLGDIDLMWGRKKEKIGLEHIIAERQRRNRDPKELLSELTTVIEQGYLPKDANGKPVTNKKGRWEISLDNKVAVITPEVRGNKMTAVLTAYYDD